MGRRLRGGWSGSLGNRLILYFTLMALASVILAGSMIYLTSDARISQSTLRLAGQVVERYSESVDGVLSSIQTLARLVRDDEQLQELIRVERQDEAQQKSVASRIGMRLKQISHMRPESNGIYVWLDDGTIAKSRYYSHLETPRMTGLEYLAVRNSAREQWYASEQGSLIVDNMGMPVLSLAMSLTDRKTGLPCGIIIVEVSRSSLNLSLKSEIGINGTMFLLDPVKGVVARGLGADPLVVESAAEIVRRQAVGLTQETIEAGDQLLICNRVASTGWVVVGVVYRNELSGDSSAILKVFVASTLLSLLVAILLSRFIAQYEMKPLEQVQAYIRRVERGHFNEEIRPVRPDEIGHLTESVRHMSGRLGELVEKQKQEQERARAAELKALQAQINPHFLYNTLDSINWLARRGDIEKTTRMISALSAFFRIALSRGSDIISLKDELEHVHNYLRIQRIRYERRFDYTIYADPALEGCLTPKLILQPLVENALYHGIKLSGHMCQLSIQVYAQGEDIGIDVTDNGTGMDAQRLEQLRRSLAHAEEADPAGYGIVNVHDRIRIYAGEQYGLSYTSAPGVGTVAHILLPRRMRKEES